MRDDDIAAMLGVMAISRCEDSLFGKWSDAKSPYKITQLTPRFVILCLYGHLLSILTAGPALRALKYVPYLNTNNAVDKV